MIKVAICDDEIQYTNQIETIVKSSARTHGIKIEIDVFYDGLHLIEHINRQEIRYDIIFLDIEMKDLDGLECARLIRKMDEIALLIYVTSHKSYAIEAYEVHPFQFVVKPIEEDVITRYFMKAYEKIGSEAFYFNYKYGKDYYKVLVNDIMYFESKKRLIQINFRDGREGKFYGKLSEVEEQIDGAKVDFWRIHQSYLVNVRHIIRKAYDSVELSDGTVLYISEDRRQEINKQYIEMIEKEMDF